LSKIDKLHFAYLLANRTPLRLMKRDAVARKLQDSAAGAVPADWRISRLGYAGMPGRRDKPQALQ
jgi:hypothetical protein